MLLAAMSDQRQLVICHSYNALGTLNVIYMARGKLVASCSPLAQREVNAAATRVELDELG